MNILIRETNQVESLGIIDPRTGINYVGDFIGNTGALSDGQFTYVDDLDAYVCDQSTFDWWKKVTTDNEALESRIYDLVQKHGYAVYDVVIRSGSNDLEDYAANANQALDDAFGE